MSHIRILFVLLLALSPNFVGVRSYVPLNACSGFAASLEYI